MSKVRNNWQMLAMICNYVQSWPYCCRFAITFTFINLSKKTVVMDTEGYSFLLISTI